MHPLLVEGLSDAVGFVGGALAAYWIGLMFGFDPLAKGYEGNTVFGIVLAGIGGGVGLQLARRWRRVRAAANKKE